MIKKLSKPRKGTYLDDELQRIVEKINEIIVAINKPKGKDGAKSL